ncbi:MAG: anthranilate phosphoribosyltransferase [Humidesulfovibrio sp.]|uniref:anthranilate phosphoribosyltransferase n=1 Tax=Humidesulfovibrio sp. TaxID=2910988 RepID=UPI0027F1F9A4|nr:anthranilate phosphoribosyltransferase [Humidesulfovibrio sp.]MDQ7836541.1 anthranilate phosphoribosyltransferase [Humidesulfovibrio sp.]
MSHSMRDILEPLASGQDLSAEQAAYAFRELFEGELSPAQAGALLMGLRAKGETALELAAAARAGLERAKLVTGLPTDKPLLDIVGTGGDLSNSFNCSTAVSLYLAALGHRVVKHGNRAVSSSSGSADALEGLGIRLDTGPDEVAAELAKSNFVFLFAPHYHPAFAHIAPVRRELAIRTLFNLMGPLLNPARPSHQLLGVGSERALKLMADTLALIAPELTAFVIHGRVGYDGTGGKGGFDELTPFGAATGFALDRGRVAPLALDPREFGIPAHNPDEVRVADKASALKAIKDVLTGKANAAMQDMTALNLGAALHLATGKDLAESIREARQAVADGAARSFVRE